jgi:hypothetical protein
MPNPNTVDEGASKTLEIHDVGSVAAEENLGMA